MTLSKSSSLLVSPRLGDPTAPVSPRVIGSGFSGDLHVPPSSPTSAAGDDRQLQQPQSRRLSPEDRSADFNSIISVWENTCWMAPHVSPDGDGAFIAARWRLHPDQYKLAVQVFRPASTSPRSLLPAPLTSPRSASLSSVVQSSSSSSSSSLSPGARSEGDALTAPSTSSSLASPLSSSMRVRLLYKDDSEIASCSFNELRPTLDSSRYFVIPSAKLYFGVALFSREVANEFRAAMADCEGRFRSLSSAELPPLPSDLASPSPSSPVPPTPASQSSEPVSSIVLNERYTIYDGWYLDSTIDYTSKSPLPAFTPPPPTVHPSSPVSAAATDLVILVDKRKDKRLANILNHGQHLAKKFPTIDSKARLLGMLVSSFMGGSDTAAADDPGKQKEIEAFFHQYRVAHAGERYIPLGSILVGGQLHRALLFKYCCDHLSPPLPCKIMIRGSAATILMPVSHHPGKYKQIEIFKPGRLRTQRTLSTLGSEQLLLASGSTATGSGSHVQPLVDESEWELDPSLYQDYQRLLNIPDLQVAQLVLLEPLGSGSFGSVHRCSLGPLQMAVKRVMKTVDASKGQKVSGLVRSLINESSLLAALSHPNIVRCLGYEDRPEEFRVFFELLGSGSFWSFMYYRKTARNPFKDDELFYYAHQVISGIVFLHSKGIGHRDIKSANIVLDGNPKFDRYYSSVKLCDFGVSIRQKSTASSASLSDPSSSTTSKVGTEQYSAPEVLSRVQNYDAAKSDIWSFGMFLVELLTLDAPYALDAPAKRVQMIKSRELPSNLVVHPHLTPILDSCARIDPAVRPSSQEILDRFERLLNREPAALAFLSARNRLSWQ